MVVAAVPESPVLSAPTVRAQAAAVDAELVLGTDSWLDRESQGLIVAAMSLPNVLTRLRPDITVIAPSDRGELLPGLLMAHQSGTFPSLAGIVLTGGYPIPEPVQRLLEGVPHNLPIVSTELGTFTAAAQLSGVRGPMSKDSTRKLEVARRLFSERVDSEALMKAINVSASEVRTPLMFEYQLMERAREADKHIVLPESTDDRILEAAVDPAAARGRPADPAGRREAGPGPRLGARPWTWRRRPSSRPPTRSWWSASPPSTPGPGPTRG